MIYNLLKTAGIKLFAFGGNMYTLGIDLGGTNIAVGLCDESLNMLDKISHPTNRDTDADGIVAQMAEICSELITKNNLTTDDIEYVGVTAPGTVNPIIGTVEYTPNLPFIDYPLAESFKELFPVGRVLVANDANAAALGEALAGAARGTRSSVMITLGTGVGGGVIIDGRIFSGGLNFSGAELGHTVIVAGGRLCGCGRRGCWETYSSATGLVRLTRERIDELRARGTHSRMCEVERVSGRTAFSLSREGDIEAQKVVDEYINYLAIGVTNMINIFQPEILLIGGGISGEGDYLIEPLTKIVDEAQYTKRNAVRTRILRATLGNDAGIIGAAGLGMQA